MTNKEDRFMSNGYVNDIRKPDDQYFADVQHVGGSWRLGLDELNASLKAGRIDRDEFWDRKRKLAEVFEHDLTIAHQKFLDRCHDSSN